MIKAKKPSKPITILLLENSSENALLIENLLIKGELVFSLLTVKERMAFEESLKNMQPDIILSELNLPDFEGFEALNLSQKLAKGIPFIYVTGSAGEETAVKALKSGATDFILKSNAGRLVPAVKRAFEECRIALERKKLYHSLKKSEENYRTLMENLPVGVFRSTLTQPGRILNTNPAAAHIHGFESMEQMLESSVEDLYFNPEDRKMFLSEIIKKEKVQNRLIHYKKRNGEAFWGSITASCHFNKSGTPDWIDGIVEDVTEKLQTEEKLKGLLKFFETLIDTISSPVFYTDNEGRYLGCNNSFAKTFFGISRNGIINKKISDLGGIVSAELALQLDKDDRELLSNTGVQEYESRVKCADGKFRFFQFSKSSYPGPDGKIAGIVGIMMDITERVENERELKRINEELDLLVKSLSSIIIGVSVKDRITHWNPFAEKVFGINSSAVIDKSFYECGIKWDWGIIYEAISNSILEEKSIRIDDLKYENTSNKNGILGLTINPLKRGGEILDGFIILGKDLTEQRILEAQLMQSNKLEAIGQLAAGVAHEINTPMQYIGDNLKFINKSFVGLTSMLDVYERACAKVSEPAEFEKILKQSEDLRKNIKLPFLIEQIPGALQQSLEGVARVSAIVHSMKAFSHPGVGTKMPANINRAIENTVTVSRNEWKYDCELLLELDENLPVVPCFESELNQVILNLIVNAKDAIIEAKQKKKTDSGLIKIKTVKNEKFALIKIEDNGTGIPSNIKSRIFDPFFTTKEVGKGTGQGLPISHSIIVEKHGGSLYFESEEGKGTTFIIKLPLDEME